MYKRQIVDGGPCTVGVESTIIDLTVTPPRLLRPGGLPLEALEEVLGEVSVDKAVTGLLAAGEHPRAPGMKYRHYAPHAPVTVATGAPDRSARRILGLLSDQAGVICFDEYARCMPGTSSIVWVRRRTNPPRPGTYSTPCAPSTARTSRKFSPSAPMTGAWVWRWPTA